MRPPLDHQLPAIAWSYQRPRVAFFMDMRLGKSLVACRWWRHHGRDAEPLLIVCPRQVIGTWIEELALEGIPAVRLHGSERDIDAALRRPVSVFVIHYEGVRTRVAVFGHPWRTIIADESGAIRNAKAKRTQAMIRLKDDVPYRAILSGMPNPDSDLDYFTQFVFLEDEFMGHTNFWKWRKAKCYQAGFAWEPRNPAEINAYVKARAYRLTRQQAGVGNPKVWETRELDLPRTLQPAYDDAEYDFMVNGEIRIWSPVISAYCRRLCGGVGDPSHPFKIRELVRCVKEELGRDERFIVWCYYQSESTAITTALDAAGVRVARIRGDTPEELRDIRRRAFRDHDLDALVIQQKCGRYGLDLSVADTAFYFSNSLEPEDRCQSEDRIVHPQKKTPGAIVDLTTVDTIDEDMRRVLRSGIETARSMMQKVMVNVRRRQAC